MANVKLITILMRRQTLHDILDLNSPIFLLDFNFGQFVARQGAWG